MRWKKLMGLSGVIGASICGACLAKTCSRSDWILGRVSAEADDPRATVTHSMSGLKLRQVQVFFRHGARTPLNTTHGIEEVAYPSDIALRTVPHTVFKYEVVVLPDWRLKCNVSDLELHYKKTQLKGGGYAGILTTYGQQQMYELGARLRNLYIKKKKLVSPDYNPMDVVQSTDMSRTIGSARCVLAGLFGKQSLNKNGPVIIPVSESDDEILFPNSKVCSVLKKANHAAMIHYDHIPGMRKDREKVEEVLGYDPAEPHKVSFLALRDDLIARVTHGYSVPDCLAPYMDMIDRNATKMIYYAMTGQHDAERPIVTRLSAGPAMYKALDSMRRARDGKKTPKIFLYSTHDSLMVALLESLGLFDWQWPPFGADFRLELYRDREGEHWVRVLYLGQEKTIRGCDSPLVHFDEFERILEPYTIDRGGDFDQICASGVLEEIAATLLEHDQDEVETDEIKEKSEIPAGM
ncbi:hypothetical protein BaRGS_00018839 [Batillaria attramentaria]|uniref:Acid phosphatase n=1 Tax=Batillaria attramentaria TaxID=370345 RepID=A0ABD0KRZ5_9CAEN